MKRGPLLFEIRCLDTIYETGVIEGIELRVVFVLSPQRQNRWPVILLDSEWNVTGPRGGVMNYGFRYESETKDNRVVTP